MLRLLLHVVDISITLNHTMISCLLFQEID
jgi:hypothetical protein